MSTSFVQAAGKEKTQARRARVGGGWEETKRMRGQKDIDRNVFHTHLTKTKEFKSAFAIRLEDNWGEKKKKKKKAHRCHTALHSQLLFASLTDANCYVTYCPIIVVIFHLRCPIRCFTCPRLRDTRHLFVLLL